MFSILIFVASLSFNVVLAETNDCYTITQEDGDVFQAVLVDETTAKIYDENGRSTGETYTYVFLEENIMELTDGDFSFVCTAVKSEFYVKEESNTTYTGGDESCTYVVELLDESQCKVVATATNGDTITVHGSYLLEGELLQISAGESDTNPLVFIVGENNTLEFYDDEDVLEDTPIEDEDIIDTSDVANYFEEEILPWIYNAIFSLTGGFSISAIVWLIFKKLLNKSLEAISKVNEELDKVKEQNELLKAQIKDLEKLNDKVEESNRFYDSTQSTINGIASALSVIVCNDPTLVANGVAKQVAKELGTNE